MKFALTNYNRNFYATVAYHHRQYPRPRQQSITVCHITVQNSQRGRFFVELFTCNLLLNYHNAITDNLTNLISIISATSEADFRSPRAKILWDKWRNVWMLAWDRQKRLHEHLMLLRTQAIIKSFDWDDWRKRFLKFHNHKRSRVVEFLKKIDRKQNGLIPREVFIEEIIKSSMNTKLSAIHTYK